MLMFNPIYFFLSPPAFLQWMYVLGFVVHGKVLCLICSQLGCVLHSLDFPREEKRQRYTSPGGCRDDSNHWRGIDLDSERLWIESPEKRKNMRDDPARPVNVGWQRNATLAKTRERLSLQLSSGQLEDLYVSSLGPSGASPKVLGGKRVIPSELCIDKGRHHSAFHNSVNNTHKNRKKKKTETSKFLKTKKERMS